MWHVLSTVHIITDLQGSKRNTNRCKKHWKQSETADGVGGKKTWNSNKLELLNPACFLACQKCAEILSLSLIISAVTRDIFNLPW